MTVMKKFEETYTMTGEVMWAKVYSADQYGKFTIDLKVEEGDGNYEMAKKLGLKIQRSKEDTYDYVQFWKYAEQKDGTPNRVRVVDSKLNDISNLIGNESICTIEFFPKAWTFGKGKTATSGVHSRLVGVQVKKLVEFIPSGGKRLGKFVEEDGFEASTETNRFAVEA